MKRITLVTLACLAVLCSYGQQSLELKIKKSSELPMTANEHLYLVEITNTSNSSKKFTIVAENVSCSEIELNKQIQLDRQILNDVKTKNLIDSIKANSSLEFFVKISRKTNTPLGFWNCTSVKAVNEANDIMSNTLIIKSLIPDPKNFN